MLRKILFLLKKNKLWYFRFVQNKLCNSSYFFVILSYLIDIFETKDNFKLSVSYLLSYLIFALSSGFWGKIILILSSSFAKFSFLTYLSKTVRCKTLTARWTLNIFHFYYFTKNFKLDAEVYAHDENPTTLFGRGCCWWCGSNSKLILLFVCWSIFPSTDGI